MSTKDIPTVADYEPCQNKVIWTSNYYIHVCGHTVKISFLHCLVCHPKYGSGSEKTVYTQPTT